MWLTTALVELLGRYLLGLLDLLVTQLAANCRPSRLIGRHRADVSRLVQLLPGESSFALVAPIRSTA